MIEDQYSDLLSELIYEVSKKFTCGNEMIDEKLMNTLQEIYNNLHKQANAINNMQGMINGILLEIRTDRKGQDDKTNKLEILVNAHEKYLSEIHNIALHDPEKTLANMKMLEERISNLEKMFIRPTDKPKMQGMPFEEAFVYLKQGKKIRRFIWHNKEWHFSKAGFGTGSIEWVNTWLYPSYLEEEDLFANDWEVMDG